MTSDDGGATPDADHGRGNESRLLRDLLTSASTGDRAAFTRLYDLTSSRIYGLAVRVVRDREYAEEVVQEAYLQYWQKAGEYHPARGSVITWMMTIAHRRAVDRVRSEQLQQDRMSAYGAASVEIPRNIPLEVVVRDDQARTLRACLGELTDLQRSCIEMSYFGGLTYPEVALRTETPLPTIKSRIRDGLRRLRSCLSTQEDS
ncbi:ECF RNA polymerase sigma factor SigK [Gordonia westfalica]|uniref:RNA polymerase sigma-70 factor, ECF subfamily n=1 Tax=Gordonia westfalica TaxID=158898 RepID=A0A1H2LT77_9ACTN|nr:ECF RNA polymerase sigma factor SigK [Gordonia westfalica]SDU84064.1 RNA polymerase sigma-70 factor, ECF subfamily [Gordonia westfalica]